MKVIFPIDYRYGWDIGFAPHQKLLEKVRDALMPKIWFWAPDCRPWGQPGNRVDPHLRELQRADALPSLEWIFKQNTFQVTHHNYFINEYPAGSDIFRHSPLEQNQDLEGFRTGQMAHQCRYGAKTLDDDGQVRPIKKPTRWDANISLRTSSQRCRGKDSSCFDGRPHCQLRGQAPGSEVCRTSQAAAYPRSLCRALITDSSE